MTDSPRTCRRCGCTDVDCSGCVERAGEPCTWVAEDLCSTCTPVQLPDEMTPAMIEVLGLPNFRAGPIAHIYRAAGFDIRRKAEDEQAFILHRFLPLAILHGTAWKEHADREVDAMLAKAKAALS